MYDYDEYDNYDPYKRRRNNGWRALDPPENRPSDDGNDSDSHSDSEDRDSFKCRKRKCFSDDDDDRFKCRRKKC
ncbi:MULTISPECIES: hypothetical protein [Bacillus]|uniref:Uncharacterized protein n=1 Tax=Bacillus glycinifermentans TaxID=1664069 RepID=A0AAJ4D4W9_9BACI|nr:MULTISPECIES: hypothetical protein [Bacillus]MDU0070536.1 hypothetical protein [Bacillus sp. IG6]MED8018400.1 hypothetical protein [Bacillus glycinifermentans]QAT67767.1 hypothetical protein EQZ20_03945 [Bacillus glycinifermentans]WKB79615.1 hypothetical protein QYM22_04030 [Bacillus glycinifermentans]SCA84524.1 hypothetical protein BGLY_0701 [Bacillus glycinifermentans]